jgi:O-antigen ligase
MEYAKLAVLGLAVLMSLGSRKHCLAILCFFLPLVQWLPDIPIPGLNAMNLLALPVIGRALAAGPPKQGNAKLDPILIPALVFIVFLTISWFRVQYGDAGNPLFIEAGGLYGNLVTFKEMLLDFVLYWAARRLVRTDEDFRFAITGIVAGFGFEAVTAAREFLFSGSWRATAHLGQPNKLGDFLSGYMMLPIAFILAGRKGWLRWIAMGLAAAALLGVFGSVSRGALIAVAAAAMLIALVRRSAWILVVAAAMATAPLWLPEKVKDRFESAVVEDSSEGAIELDVEHEGRVQLWQCGSMMIKDNPMIGVGLNQFGYHLREYGYTLRKLKSSHDIYIQLAAEQGLPASAAHVLMVFMFGGLAYGLSRRRKDERARVFGLGMLGVVVSFALGSIFGDGFYENNLSGLYWILGGITVNLSRDNVGPDGPAPAPAVGERRT